MGDIAQGIDKSLPSLPAVGFIGLGQIGLPIAQQIACRDHRLVVHDLDREASSRVVGAEVAEDARQIADQCDIVFSCVSSTKDYDEVALGRRGLIGGAKLRVYVHLGTTGVAHVRRLAAALSGSGVDTIDAPVSGGVVGALNGTLTSMLSGSPAALSRARPVISCYSRFLFDFGDDPGMAQIVKIINNNIANANLITAIEGLAMGVKAGVDPIRLADTIAAGTGSSFANDTMIRREVLTGSFAWGGSLQIILKDLLAWGELADELNVRCALNRTAADLFVAAIKELGPNNDITEVAKIIEKNEGVAVTLRNHG
jgi:3-hydroxyisobutyrate dehydrogenase-like beta-hydroxyacid dehydrogenase